METGMYPSNIRYRKRVKHPYTVIHFENGHTILVNACSWNTPETIDLLLNGLQFHGVIDSQYTVYVYTLGV